MSPNNAVSCACASAVRAVIAAFHLSQPGDRVRVRVLHLNLDRGRITFSTKKLEQAAGDMLRDPQLVYQVAEEMAARFRANQRQ